MVPGCHCLNAFSSEEDMGFFLTSFISAFDLLVSLDPELLTIVQVSLIVSFSSTIIAAIMAIPLGFYIAYGNFRCQRAIITVLNTMLALPTVVIALFVYTFISRRSILGSLDMLYTTKAIVFGQVILIVPLIAALTIAAINRVDKRYRKTAKTLGASDIQAAIVDRKSVV
jgi:tungstate transport system permease protein